MPVTPAERSAGDPEARTLAPGGRPLATGRRGAVQPGRGQVAPNASCVGRPATKQARGAPRRQLHACGVTRHLVIGVQQETPRAFREGPRHALPPPAAARRGPPAARGATARPERAASVRPSTPRAERPCLKTDGAGTGELPVAATTKRLSAETALPRRLRLAVLLNAAPLARAWSLSRCQAIGGASQDMARGSFNMEVPHRQFGAPPERPHCREPAGRSRRRNCPRSPPTNPLLPPGILALAAKARPLGRGAPGSARAPPGTAQLLSRPRRDLPQRRLARAKPCQLGRAKRRQLAKDFLAQLARPGPARRSFTNKEQAPGWLTPGALTLPTATKMLSGC